MLTLYANFKGGTGKSTVVFNMAIWRMAQGHDVTVCDLDPQRTLTDVAQIREESGISPPLKVVHKLPTNGAPRGDWLIDAGASGMAALRAAVRASDQILIPVTPSQADIWATQQFLDIIENVRTKGAGPTVTAFINRADSLRQSRENVETQQALGSLPGVKALPQHLVQRLVYRRSFSEGLAVFELEPNSKAATELGQLARAIYGRK